MGGPEPDRNVDHPQPLRRVPEDQRAVLVDDGVAGGVLPAEPLGDPAEHRTAFDRVQRHPHLPAVAFRLAPEVDAVHQAVRDPAGAVVDVVGLLVRNVVGERPRPRHRDAVRTGDRVQHGAHVARRVAVAAPGSAAHRDVQGSVPLVDGDPAGRRSAAAVERQLAPGIQVGHDAGGAAAGYLASRRRRAVRGVEPGRAPGPAMRSGAQCHFTHTVEDSQRARALSGSAISATERYQ